MAPMNAFWETYFSICQGVIRKLDEICMRPVYESNDYLRTAVRGPAALTHAAAEVVEVIYVLAEYSATMWKDGRNAVIIRAHVYSKMTVLEGQ